MRRSAEEAKAHVLHAAEAEFALYGVTGARIDRIAKEAGVSKERLYAYFGDKQNLFEEVTRTAVRQVYDAVRIEADDLVSYAGRLAEHFFARPADLRILAWARLDEQCERAGKVDAVAARSREEAEALRRAQENGAVDPAWDPDELLRLILAVATYWATASGPGLTSRSRSRYRAVVEEAVRRLIQPPVPAAEAGIASSPGKA